MTTEEEGNGLGFMDVTVGPEIRRNATENWLCEFLRATDAQA